jgi:hypothetical protein
VHRPTADHDARQPGTRTMSPRLDLVSGWLLVCLTRPTQDRFDACLKLVELEGFCHEIGGAELQAQYAVDLALSRAADDNGRACQCPEGQGQGEAVGVGQHKVQDDEVGLGA